MLIGVFGFLDSLPACRASSSSSSLSVWAALSERARRSLPLRPPLRIMLAVGVSSIAAKSLSSRDIRFSDAVKLPCDKGEGRAGRGLGADEADAGEGTEDEEDVEDAAGRLDVAVELLDEEDTERLWGGARG